MDSLLQLLPAAKADTNAVLLYIDLGEHYRNAGDLKYAAEYHLKAQTLSRKLNYLHGLYYASDYYSFILARQGLYDSALVVNNEILNIAIQHADIYQAAIEQWNLGAVYLLKGFNEMALTYLMESVTYLESANYQEDAGLLYYTIQSIYARMYRHEEAIRYGEKALYLQKDTLSAMCGYTLLNLSVNYYKLKPPQNEKALTYLQKVLHIAGLTGNATLEANAHNCIANIYFSTNCLSESETYYRKALAFFKEETYPNGFCVANIGLAKIAMFRNDFAKAEAMAQQNLAIARRHGIRLEEKNNLSFLWELSAAKHDFSGRNRYKAAFDSVQNLVVNETMLRAAEELKVKYETEKKETQIAALESEKKTMTWLGIAVGAVLLLTLATFFFLWRWTVQKKRLAESRGELVEQEKQLADRQIKQLEQEKQLIATQSILDGEIQERIRLARDLHDSLGSILAAAKYKLVDIKQISMLGEDDMKHYNEAISLLDDSMDEMRRVAHHLMPEPLFRTGLKQSVADFCNTIPIVKFSYYGDESRFDPKLEVMVYRILHELVTNALKHAGAKHILVQLVRDEDSLALVVQDDGRGFNLSTESKGTGLRNIRARVESFNGNLDIDSQPGEGTEIRIEFPIKN